MTGGVRPVLSPDRDGWHPGAADDRAAERGHGIDAVLGGGGEVTADGEPVAGDVLRLQSAGDLLLGLVRSQVTLGEIVCRRDLGVGAETQDVVFPVAQAFEQVAGGQLLGVCQTTVRLTIKG